MINIYDFNNYHSFLSQWIKEQPRGGRGELSKLAASAKTSVSVLSVVLRRERNLTIDQACGIAKYLQFNNQQTDYFITLVQLGRAGSTESKSYFKEKVAQFRSAHKKLANRLPHQKMASTQVQAQFYSDWIYSAIWNLLAAGIQDRNQLAQRLTLSRSRVDQVIEFLLEGGLCRQVGTQFEVAVDRTHVDQSSPWVTNHHRHWRLKNLQSLSDLNHDQELSLTFPMTISKRDIREVRKRLVAFIESLDPLVRESECEACACLAIDWIRF